MTHLAGSGPRQMDTCPWQKAGGDHKTEITRRAFGEKQRLTEVAVKNILQTENADEVPELANCIGCGCNDNQACWDENAGQPCSWLRVDRNIGLGVCSACPGYLERWELGDREVDVPIELKN